MRVPKQSASIMIRALFSWALASLIYVVLLLLLPANSITRQTDGLSDIQYHIILFAVAVPYLLTWLAAFDGYARLYQYAHTIHSSREGPYFRQLARGCTWLAWSFPIISIVILTLGAIADHWTGLQATSIIISNYLSLLLPLVAFTMIGRAARGLVTQAGLKFSLSSAQAIMLLFVAAGVSYCYLVFRQFDLSNLGSTRNPYYLPLWLIVLTLVIPYLYTWFVGLLAAYEISLFSRRAPGLLYKRALRLLVSGLVIVIISSIALQYINGVRPIVGHLVIDYKLLLASALRIIRGLGFVLIILGAVRLKRIEEV